MENNLTKIEEIVKAFGKTVEVVGQDMPTKYPAMVFPQSLLPFPKKDIQEALNYFIEKTEQDEKMEKHLMGAVSTLTLFIDDKEAEKRNKPHLDYLKSKEKND